MLSSTRAEKPRIPAAEQTSGGQISSIKEIKANQSGHALGQ